MSIPLNFNPLGFTLATVEPSELPAGYTRLAFLGCDGAQWVDTGFTADNETSVKYTYFPGTTTSSHVYTTFGARYSFQNREFGSFVYFQEGRTRIARGTDTLSFGYSAELSTVEVTPENASLLGESKAWTTNTDFETPYTLLVGAMRVTKTYADYRFYGRFYEFIMWSGDVEQCNLVPAVDPVGVPCFFDKTATAPKYNLGSQLFTAGLETLDQLTALASNLPTVTGSPEIKLSVPGEWNGDASANEQLNAINSKGWQATISYRTDETTASSSFVWGGRGDGAAARVVLWCKTVASEYGNYQDANGNKYYIETCNDIWRSDGLSPDDLGYSAAADLDTYLTEQNLIPVEYPEEELIA